MPFDLNTAAFITFLAQRSVRLHTLHLTHVYTDEDGHPTEIDDIVESISHHTALRTLRLVGNDISGIQSQTLQPLAVCRDLATLLLNFPSSTVPIHDGEINALVTPLRNLRNLTLHLGTSPKALTMQSLIYILQACPRLYALTLLADFSNATIPQITPEAHPHIRKLAFSNGGSIDSVEAISAFLSHASNERLKIKGDRAAGEDGIWEEINTRVSLFQAERREAFTQTQGLRRT